MIVVDASVVVDVLIGEGRGVELLAADDLAAPHLLDAEVASVVRRSTLSDLLAEADARQALDDLAELEIERVALGPLLPRAWELRENLTIYDGLYVALAEHLAVPLVTIDLRVAAAPGVRAVIQVPPAR